jgi:sec-independent protein translocase protein TatA
MRNFGALEIGLIVLAVVLIFGIGKLGQVGGALGKSIREFRRERDKKDGGSSPALEEGRGEKASQSTKEKFCPSCGSKLAANAKFCMECGAKTGDFS